MNKIGLKEPAIAKHFGKIAFALAVFYICYTFSRELYPDHPMTAILEEVGYILFGGFAFLFVGGWVLFLIPTAFGVLDKADLMTYLVLGLMVMPIAMFFFSILIVSFLYFPMVFLGHRDFEVWIAIFSSAIMIWTIKYIKEIAEFIVNGT